MQHPSDQVSMRYFKSQAVAHEKCTKQSRPGLVAWGAAVVASLPMNPSALMEYLLNLAFLTSVTGVPQSTANASVRLNG